MVVLVLEREGEACLKLYSATCSTVWVRKLLVNANWLLLAVLFTCEMVIIAYLLLYGGTEVLFVHGFSVRPLEEYILRSQHVGRVQIREMMAKGVNNQRGCFSREWKCNAVVSLRDGNSGIVFKSKYGEETVTNNCNKLKPGEYFNYLYRQTESVTQKLPSTVENLQLPPTRLKRLQNGKISIRLNMQLVMA